MTAMDSDAMVKAMATAIALRNHPSGTEADIAEMADGFALDAAAALSAIQPTIERQATENARLRAALEPFALVSREGVISASSTGHVSVTTCAEYFHTAAQTLKETSHDR